MAINPRKGKLLYHLTTISNFKSILNNGLLPRDECETFTDLANREIIECREENDLLKYIPFHFFGGTPFAGAVQIDHSNEEFIFITIHRSYAKNNGYKIIPSHPLSVEKIQLFDYDKGFEEIKWALMAERNYTKDECKNVCMAECLTNSRIPASDFYTIFAKNEEEKKKILVICSSVFNGDIIPFNVTVNKYLFRRDD